MKRMLTICFALLTACPSLAAADDLDLLLNDLILERESKVQAQIARKKDTRRAALSANVSAFPEVERYNSQKAERSEKAGVVQYKTTYYPVRAGTAYHVELTYSLKRAGINNYSRMKDLALLFNRSARIDGFTISGYYAAYINSRGDRASGIIVALDADTYLTIRSSSPVNRQTLSRFASKFSAEDLLRLKRSYGI